MHLSENGKTYIYIKANFGDKQKRKEKSRTSSFHILETFAFKNTAINLLPAE